MPFTALHIGPGLLVKSSLPRRFSLAAFVATQVVIDVETFYWLVRQAWPVHRVLHTFLGGAVVGVVVALILRGFAHTSLGRQFALRGTFAGELEAAPLLLGGMVGGLSHSLLDGIMHADIQPFRPLSTENPLLGSMDVGYLHLACVATGLLGLVIMMIRRARRTRLLSPTVIKESKEP